MKLLAFSFLFVSLLVPDLGDGQEIEERILESSQGQEKDEDWRKFQLWYLSSTAVSMNVKDAWRAGYTGKGVLVAVVDDGVNNNHTDLVSNLNLTASYDFLSDQMINTNHDSDSHGTKCAGIIAGGNNQKCGVGIAFDAQISSIRLYDESINRPSTDELEAKALSFKRDMIDIYSNSWGPGDRAFEVEGPGPQLREALENGTRLGRHGKGSIFVFAAGNGGVLGDSCAYSGYVNSIHTIAISGVNWDGSVPAYTEACAAIMAVTYGQDMFRYGKYNPPLVTVKGSNDCTEKFPGTSGTTALASGIIALALQANPKLTWRDVQHLIARSSKPIRPPKNRRTANRPRPIWIQNAAGLKVSGHYGFGLMDAISMVKYAEEWRSVPPQLSCELKLNVSNSSRLVIHPHGRLHFTLSLRQESCSIRYLEHMQAEVNLRFPRRGDLEMISTSPSGTKSKLLYPRIMDSLAGFRNYTNLRVTSLHYWGEKPIGDWFITIRNTKPRNNVGKGRVFGLKLILYGTKEDPLAENEHVVDRNTKRTRTVNIARREQEIPIHGGYSPWSYWGRCSRQCGRGTQKRYRLCTNPRPENNGRDCSGLGPDRESRICDAYRCQVDGGYSEWTRWSQCGVTCGNGTQERHRSCTNPRPAYGGKPCTGHDRQRRTCRTATTCPEHGLLSSLSLPVHGGYSQWSHWSSCTRTCAGGIQRRSRSCTNPPPLYGGRDCRRLGPHRESRECNTNNCPACTNIAADRLCLQYFNNGLCSNPSIQKMCRRTCICQVCRNTAADTLCQQYFNEGLCSNPSVRGMCRKTCGLCPAVSTRAGYSQWSSWSSCTRTCAGGTQQRSRSCNGRGDCRRLGPDRESRECNTQSCPVCGNIAADTLCQQQFNDGLCSNPSVRGMCRKTCGLCPACKNIWSDQWCQDYFNQGLCSNPTVRNACQKTCHSC